MCRITGIINKNLLQIPAVDQVERMCHSMQHGRLDGHGYLNDYKANVFIGHRRLSIIDLSIAGQQSMENEQKTISISYNDVIYNFKTLKLELIQASYLFKTQSDTEVIIYDYPNWCENAFSKYNGVFALYKIFYGR